VRAAGWVDVALQSHVLRLLYAGAGTTPQEAVDIALEMPMTRAIVDPRGPTAVVIAAAALLEVFQTHHEPNGVAFDGAIAIVTARRP